MHRTLRITSVIVALGAVGLLILPVVYGVRKDPAIEELLNSPGAVENFAASRGDNASREAVSPLVKLATDFSLYLNPPPPPVEEAPPMPDIEAPDNTPQPMSPVTAKFDLIGTSYYANKPELSLCLIDEPGKGLIWVRQGDTVGHLVIEEVKDGLIIVKDGQRKFEMTVPVQERWKELLLNPPGGKPASTPASVSMDKPASKTAASPQGRPAPHARSRGTGASPRSPRDARRSRPGTPAENPMPAGPNPTIQPARDSRIVTPPAAEPESQKEISAPEEAPLPAPPIPSEKDIIHIRLMEEVRANRLTLEEAKRIEETVQTIEQLDEIQVQISQQKITSEKNKSK